MLLNISLMTRPVPGAPTHLVGEKRVEEQGELLVLARVPALHVMQQLHTLRVPALSKEMCV